MKTRGFFLLLFFGIIPFIGNAQIDYFSSNQQWVLYGNTPGPTFPGDPLENSTQIIYVSDSNVLKPNGELYYVLGSKLLHMISSSSNPTGTITYTEDSAVYYMRQDGYKIFSYYDSSEHLIVDYDFSIGDTIPAGHVDDSIFKIDSIFYGGVPHRRFYTDSGFNEKYVIEGVYNIAWADKWFTQTFWNAPAYVVPAPYFSQVGCFWRDEMNDSLKCTSVLTLDVSSYDSNMFVEIYPNPVADNLTVSSDGIDRVEIHDLTGKLVLAQFHNSKTTLNINVENLNSGLYVINCIGKNGTGSKRFVKK